ncbi:MAG: TIGR03000 domain-containing protein [Gemmataceae bacterium]|nr:TIGR03000 domain-containing protein [Gemmata sp.]MDW8198996.1 TIGR03000 domain-containing protein [Gemmataceae bacterium]
MVTVRTSRAAALVLAFVISAGLSSLSVSAQPGQDKKDPAKKLAKSKLKVIVPQDDAILLIEGKETKVTGKEREFVTPELEVGKLYEYSFEVRWEPNNYTKMTRTKSIEFKGGEDIIADLSKADPKNPDKAVIRWVPTPDDIVEEMIKLAGVKKGDIVYEPGPGDGRVLIAAVKKGAEKAVGIELDEKKVEEAREAIKKAGLEKQITIIQGDALKDRDYSEATVVFLYMGNEFNNLLRPILEKQLKPGTRIVSHRFTMGDWKPDKSIVVTGADGDEYMLHLWIMPEKKK